MNPLKESVNCALFRLSQVQLGLVTNGYQLFKINYTIDTTSHPEDLLVSGQISATKDGYQVTTLFRWRLNDLTYTTTHTAVNGALNALEAQYKLLSKGIDTL